MYEEKESVKKTNYPANKVSFLTVYRCEQAIQLLEKQIANIPDVQSWAKEAGVSREWLYKSVKESFGKSPKIILREIRYIKVITLIMEQGLEAGCYSVGVDAGFRDSAALSKFLSSFYKINFTNLKVKILNGNVRIASIWLNGIHK